MGLSLAHKCRATFDEVSSEVQKISEMRFELASLRSSHQVWLETLELQRDVDSFAWHLGQLRRDLVLHDAMGSSTSFDASSLTTCPISSTPCEDVDEPLPPLVKRGPPCSH